MTATQILTNQVAGLAEFIRDTIGAADTAGSGITITVDDGGDTITFAASGGGGGTAIGQNLVTNGRFRTNQRTYATGTSTASGSYAFDRWKSGAAASTLTFTAAPQGQAVTINSGGVWQHVIAQARIEATGHVLSWAGTATGRVYNVGGSAPSYAASPVTVTLDGTADVVIEFTASGATKTLEKVKLELGSTPTDYDQPSSQAELAECMRFFQQLSGWTGVGEGTTAIACAYRMPVPMRAAPTLSKAPGIALNFRNNSGDTSVAAATWTIANAGGTFDHVWFQFATLSGLTALRPYHDRGTTAGAVWLTADL